MQALRNKSLEMTTYLEFLLHSLQDARFEIITPGSPERRGCQLSLLYASGGRKVFEALTEAGIIADWREPNVIRVAPVPLYNTYSDCQYMYSVMAGL